MASSRLEVGSIPLTVVIHTPTHHRDKLYKHGTIMTMTSLEQCHFKLFSNKFLLCAVSQLHLKSRYALIDILPIPSKHNELHNRKSDRRIFQPSFPGAKSKKNTIHSVKVRLTLSGNPREKKDPSKSRDIAKPYFSEICCS